MIVTRRAALGLLIGMRVVPASARKHRGPRRCPKFTPDGICAAGEVWSVAWNRCLPRSGVVDGQTYYCKGHGHPWFVVADDGTLHCCRRDCPITIATMVPPLSVTPVATRGPGRGLCHRWPPRTCVVESTAGILSDERR